MDSNPEVFFFEYENIAFFGVNRVSGESYVNNFHFCEDLNNVWIEEKLNGKKTTSSYCNLETIVIFTHDLVDSTLYEKFTPYFNDCGSPIPILTVSGNTHPSTHCMTESNGRIDVVVEAFRSGPLLVSIVRDLANVVPGNFIHVEDTDPVDSNKYCPDFQ
mmetsp:Transcript_34300/g.58221  ORF Transcript_34300/g.58221 Transcript_34300/m.58221 type:complete len:160 (+) Transcript_34300:48-527(+)